MKVEHSHNLDINEVRNRINKFGEFLSREGISMNWESDNKAKVVGKYKVVIIDATVTISDKNVSIQGKDPGFLFRKVAENFLKEKMKEYLS